MPPKRQHYVPRFYLENFATEGADDSLGFWVYDKAAGKTRWQTPINTAVEGYFYTITREGGVKDNSIEKFLSDAEAIAAPIITAWIADSARPTDGEIAEMASFVALLETRGPRSIAAVREMAVAFATEEMKSLAQDPDRLRRYLAEMKEEDGVDVPQKKALEALAQVGEGFDLTVDDEYAMAESLKLTDTVANGLRGMAWSLCVSERAPFITSDTPVCIFLPVGNGRAIFGAGFAEHLAEVTIPLSPTVCLLISHRSSQRRIRASEARVYEYNRRAAYIAERFMISTLQTRRVEALAAEAKRTLAFPKIDKDEFGALVREGMRRFGLKRSRD
jgi:hypothetical protein